MRRERYNVNNKPVGCYMAERRPLSGRYMVIDPQSPWKVTQRNWIWPLYAYKTSKSEWRALLARAQRGDPEAEWEVADRYNDGCKGPSGKIAVRRSRRKGIEWFQRAAEHGFSPAQNALGVLLGNEEGTKKNVGKSLSWLRRAFHAGDSCAAYNIAITYRQIGDLAMAVKWLQKSLAAGNDSALIQLGIHNYWGKGIRKNPKAAFRYFRTATIAKNISEAERDDAFFLLGVAYSEGQGVKTSIPKARKAFKRANIDNDHPAARKMLRQLER